MVFTHLREIHVAENGDCLFSFSQKKDHTWANWYFKSFINGLDKSRQFALYISPVVEYVQVHQMQIFGTTYAPNSSASLVSKLFRLKAWNFIRFTISRVN